MFIVKRIFKEYLPFDFVYKSNSTFLYHSHRKYWEEVINSPANPCSIKKLESSPHSTLSLSSSLVTSLGTFAVSCVITGLEISNNESQSQVL